MRIKKKHKTCVNTFFKYKLLYVSLMAVTKQNLQYIHKRERNLSIPIVIKPQEKQQRTVNSKTAMSAYQYLL